MRQVLDLVESYRAQARSQAAAESDGAGPSGEAAGTAKDPCLYRVPLHEVTAWLAGLPPVEVVMARIRKLNRYDPVAVEKAARWLSDFAIELDDTLVQSSGERHVRLMHRTPDLDHGPRSAHA
jgi:hypothetical protein